MRLSPKINYLVFILFFSFITIELSFTLFSLIGNKKIKRNNMEIKYYRTISGMNKELKKEDLLFRTDSYGSVIPSSVSKLDPNRDYVLFCGGSSTEASQVNEGKRPTDIFMQNKKYGAVNLAMAKRGLEGCINVIRNFHEEILSSENIKNPSKYVIAANYNTFSDFLRVNFKNNIKSQYGFSSFGTNFYKLISKISNRNKINKKIGIDLSAYEHAVLEGCCFRINIVNDPKILPKASYWNSEKLVMNYKKYLKSQLLNLNDILKNYGIEKKQVYFFIEPHSYSIEYKELFRDYWKGLDGRQKIYDYKGQILTVKRSAKILNKFNNVFSSFLSSRNYQVLTLQNNLPKWSFYDGGHYTDVGAESIGKFYIKNIK